MSRSEFSRSPESERSEMEEYERVNSMARNAASLKWKHVIHPLLWEIFVHIGSRDDKGKQII